MKDLRKTFAEERLFLMEGALGERLRREYGLRIDGTVAMADLVRSEAGRRVLSALWREYAAIAAAQGLPFLAATPTRRANRARMAEAGYDAALLRENVTFLRETLADSGARWFAGGLMGCRGDAYTGEGALTAETAAVFHAWQAEALAEAGADFLMAGIMPALPEALGMARAMAGTGLPYLISFTITPEGFLVDGTPISDAVATIDSELSSPPLFYMTNCIHPRHAARALSQEWNRVEAVRTRFLGVQANASPLSYAELDGAADLRTAEPGELARDMAALLPLGIRVFGGCCGTDCRHMAAIAAAVTESAKNTCAKEDSCATVDDRNMMK